MKANYNKGAFICSDCHMTIHESILDDVFDNFKLYYESLNDKHITLEKFNNCLIHNIKNIDDLIKESFELGDSKRIPLMKFLLAVLGLSLEKGLVTSIDIIENMRLSKSSVNYLFKSKQDILKKYGELFIGTGGTPTKFYINNNGRLIIHLIYYFRAFYGNLNKKI